MGHVMGTGDCCVPRDIFLNEIQKSTGTYAYFQEIIARESASKPSTPKPIIANRVYSRFSVSVQRSIANNIMEFRYGQVPAQLVVGAGA